MKYRIVENNGIFTIQVLIKETKGFFWWKKQVDVWYDCSTYGFPIFGGIISPPIQRYKSLEFAEFTIKEWQKPKKEIVYHEVDYSPKEVFDFCIENGFKKVKQWNTDI